MSVLEAPAVTERKSPRHRRDLVRTGAAEMAAGSPAAVTEIPGLTVLGFGYDIFGLYADPRSTISKLFNFEDSARDLVNVGNHAYRVPAQVSVLTLAEGEQSLLFGDTITEFQQQFSLRAGLEGKYGYFTGSIEAQYDRSVIENAEWQFLTIRDSAASWLLVLDQNEKLMPHIDPDFQHDLNDVAYKPEELFKKYGTHFVAKAIIGGSAVYNCHVSTRLGVTQEASEAQVKAGYSSLTGSVHFHGSVGLKSDYKTFQSAYNSNLLFRGGDLGKGFEMADQRASGGFPAWAATVNDDPVLVDFDKDSLRPIWQLATSPDRRSALQTYYKEVFLPKHEALVSEKVQPELEGLYITDMEAVFNSLGSLTKLNAEFFSPSKKIPAGYHCLGHYAQGGANYKVGSKPFNTMLVVKDLGHPKGGKAALVEPVAYSQVWSQDGNALSHGGSIWRPTPPEGYVALGFVVLPSSENKQPSTGAIRCVRKDLVDKATFGPLVWQEGGDDGKVSIYDIVANPIYGRRTGCFHAQPNNGAASGTAWTLMASALKP